MDWVETSGELRGRRELGLLIYFIFDSIREFTYTQWNWLLNAKLDELNYVVIADQDIN